MVALARPRRGFFCAMETAGEAPGAIVPSGSRAALGSGRLPGGCGCAAGGGPGAWGIASRAAAASTAAREPTTTTPADPGGTRADADAREQSPKPPAPRRMRSRPPAIVRSPKRPGPRRLYRPRRLAGRLHGTKKAPAWSRQGYHGRNNLRQLLYGTLGKLASAGTSAFTRYEYSLPT